MTGGKKRSVCQQLLFYSDRGKKRSVCLQLLFYSDREKNALSVYNYCSTVTGKACSLCSYCFLLTCRYCSTLGGKRRCLQLLVCTDKTLLCLHFLLYIDKKTPLSAVTARPLLENPAMSCYCVSPIERKKNIRSVCSHCSTPTDREEKPRSVTGKPPRCRLLRCRLSMFVT